MKRKNVTRSALFTSIISLLLCVSMLVGTTFAWFTDEVKSGTNVIAAGNLDVELYHSNKNDAREKVTGNTILFNEVTNNLWEPGALAYENFEVVNAGTLALKYKMNLMTLEQSVVNGYKLGDVIKVGFKQGGFTSTTREGVIDEVSEWKTLTEFTLSKNGVKLTKESTDTFGLVLYWQPNDNATDNHYNVPGDALKLTVGIELFATQVENEADSFGIDYDQNAGIPGSSVTPAPDAGTSAAFGNIEENDEVIASYDVPKGAVDPDADEIVVEVKKTTETPNFTVEANLEVQPYEVKVEGLKENNDVPVKVKLRIPTGKDPATVKLYHYDQEIPCTYNPTTGMVTFESATFSPFFVVYDANSVYVAPEIPEGTAKPQASVVETPEYVNVELPWGSYGQWSPTDGLDANLEAAYKFSVTETLEQVEKNPYANWYCDFYVKLDKPLAPNQIFLGGKYGSFGWVGFHNGDVTLGANEEIPLLGSVTSTPWTYLDVAKYVGTFICGVGDVDDALADAKFTVMLRLTNPENENDFFNVSEITHTFTKTVTTGEELQDAVNNGNQNIDLGGDIDLSQGLVIPGE